VRGKLIALNLALLAALGLIVTRFRQVSAGAREREARVLGQKIPPQKYPPLPMLTPATPLVAAGYIDVAAKMVLARDRNPNVIIDPEPVKEKPKMPPLPVVEGMMMMGDPTIFMSERPGSAQRAYHTGEKVGAFKLVAFDSNRVVLDWDGETVERKLEDLLEKEKPPPENTANAGAGAAAAAAPVANTAPPVAPTPQGPGVDTGGGFRACLSNDSTPSGTVRDGLRKVEIATPFGRSCRWEPAR
jgi:hypothetical protein